MSQDAAADPSANPRDTAGVDTRPFTEVLRDQIAQRQVSGGNLAVLLIECGVIDRIDAVWGYHVGNAVRGRVASLLRAEVLRPGDRLAEMGRDDFACVLSSIDGPAVALLAAEKTLRALKAPFWIGEEEIFANASIGIAMCPSHGDDPDILLQRAKNACVSAREQPGRIADYAQDSDNPAEAKLLYENKLRTAVSDDTLDLVFQPQYDLRLGQMMGAACVLRWRDGGAGFIAAEEAFTAAESAGVVTNLVSSILNRALRNISEFRYSAGLDLRISVKIPARVLLHTELPDVVQRALGTWNLRAGRLVLEIGETSVLGREPVARETLLRLKDTGVKLSIDDSGMALSSLFQLASLPFQEIKIDVSLARDPGSAPTAAGSKSETILRSVIDLAHKLQLDVLAIGVENEEAASRLKELGCDAMQADYRGQAVDPKRFVELFGHDED